MYDFKKKQVNININNKYALAKTLSMFEYENLPETIPYYELEKQLQSNGYVFITEVEGELYALTGGLGGVPDVYGNPTEIIIANPALKFNKTLNLKEDGILIRSDDSYMGLIPLFSKYNTFMVENDITMMLNGYNNRMQTLISASDDKTKASAEAYLTKLVEGELGVIGEAALFEGVKTHNSGQSQSNGITSLIEFQQYMKASLMNEIGLAANFNMKRERLNTAEVDQNEDGLYPFVDNMMKCRLEGIEALNAKYSLNVLIDYGGVWNKKNKDFVDNIVSEESENLGGEVSNGILEESLNESLDESLNESLDESLNESEEELEIENEILEIEEELQEEEILDDEIEVLLTELNELKGELDEEV